MHNYDTEAFHSHSVDTEVCSLHFVNEGAKVNGSTDAVVEWQGTGPDANRKVSIFTCWRDKIRTSFPCKSHFISTNLVPWPYVW